MDRDDLRLMSVLVTWLSLHRGFVRVKVLQELLRDQSPRVRAFWAAIANWSTPTSRWHLLAQRDALEAPTELLRTGTRFLLARHGEDPRFAASGLIVPRNVLSDRKSTVPGAWYSRVTAPAENALGPTPSQGAGPIVAEDSATRRDSNRARLDAIQAELATLGTQRSPGTIKAALVA